MDVIPSRTLLDGKTRHLDKCLFVAHAVHQEKKAAIPQSALQQSRHIQLKADSLQGIGLDANYYQFGIKIRFFEIIEISEAVFELQML